MLLQVIQVYIHWQKDSLPAPKLQLVGFKRTMIAAGKQITAEFTVTSQQMALWMDSDTPPGFKVMPGKGNSPILSAKNTFLVEISYRSHNSTMTMITILDTMHFGCI